MHTHAYTSQQKDETSTQQAEAHTQAAAAATGGVEEEKASAVAAAAAASAAKEKEESLRKEADERAAAAEAFLDAYSRDTTFVVALLYAALNASNMQQYPTADSLLRIVALSADRLTPYHRLWLDYRQALLSQDRPSALQ